MDNVDLTTENAIFLTGIINEVINNGPIANTVSMNVEGACECVCGSITGCIAMLAGV